MLYKAKTLKGYRMHCLDGSIGTVKEFYFDDNHWTTRYLVADTGNWLPGRQVLISPYSLVDVRRERQEVIVELTKKQIEDSPSLDSDKPVSRQFEMDFYGFYAWPVYWDGPLMWGPFPNIERDREKATGKGWGEGEKKWDPHLRSTREVTGYNIQALDGEVGHVEDFIFDDQTWAIRYLVIDTENWLPGKKVLVSPQWAERVSWSESKVFIDLTREAIRQSPEYTEELLLTREYESALHQHYNRDGYWGNG